MKYTLIKGKANLSAAIAAVCASALSARDEIQNVLINTEIHYLETGDFTLMDNLLKGLDNVKGLRTQGLTAHIKKFCEVTAVDGKDTHGRTVKATGLNTHAGIHKGGKNALTEAARKDRIENAKLQEWYTMGPGANQTAFSSFDADTIVKQFMVNLKRKETQAIEAMPEGLIGEAKEAWLRTHIKPLSPAVQEELLKTLNINSLIDAVLNPAPVEEKLVEVPSNVTAQSVPPAKVEEITGKKPRRGKKAIVDRRQAA